MPEGKVFDSCLCLLKVLRSVQVESLVTVHTLRHTFTCAKLTVESLGDRGPTVY
jgi:integrase